RSADVCSAHRPLTPQVTRTFRHRRAAAALLHAVWLSAVGAAALAAQQFSPERLARIDSVMERYVAESRVAGVVALVLQDGEPVYERAFGWSDREAGTRMTAGTIFRIASQTKAVTSVAALMLVEQGALSLDDPVGMYLPT